MSTLDLICVRHSNKFLLCGRLGRHSFRAPDVASTSPKYELGKVALSSMFLKRKKSQRFRASSFSKFHHTRQKNPVCYLGRSCTEPKKPFAIGRHSERCSYNTDYSRFVLPVSNPSALNLSQFVGIQNFPEWIQNEKVAETLEVDGKEPLFSERAMCISKRVLGWTPWTNGQKTYVSVRTFREVLECFQEFQITRRVPGLLETAQETVTVLYKCVHQWTQ